MGLQGPQPIRVTRTWKDFSAPGATVSVPVLTLAPGQVCMGTRVRVTTPFRGGNLTACSVTVTGLRTGATYAPATDVFNANVAPTLASAFQEESHQFPVAVLANMTGTGDNLNKLTQGSVDFLFLVMEMI